jgi:DNA-directed RNA polymerase specialized sigma24 family protein
MPSESSDVSRGALLKHLEQVYEMARVLAPTERRAAKLVEATYRRAAQSAPPSGPNAVRAWLLRLLLQTYATRRSDAATTSSVSTMRRPADLLQDFRRQTAQDVLQRAVPVAFVLQPPREQLVLTLCDIVALDAREVAVVLDTDPKTLNDEVTSARRALWAAVRRELTKGERALVNEELPDGALQKALRCVVAPHLGPIPPTLRPSVSALMDQPSAASEPSPDDDGISVDFSRPRSIPQANSNPSRGRSSWLAPRLQRITVALFIILITGVIGYLLSSYLTPSSTSTPTDLLQLSVQRTEAVQPTMQTSDLTEVEQFVAEQLGRSIAVPRIDSAMLRGVSIVEMETGIRIPAFVFSDTTSDHRITTYAYTYAVIDQFGDRVQLTQDIRQELQNEQQVNLHSTNESGVLVWRVRDDIYVAVTKADPQRVRPRIGPAS